MIHNLPTKNRCLQNCVKSLLMATIWGLHKYREFQKLSKIIRIEFF